MATPASASDTVSTNTLLTAEASVFNVSVPTSIPVYVDSKGVVTTGDTFGIMNNSAAPIQLDSLEISSLNDWELVSYETDFSGVSVNTKQYAVDITDTSDIIINCNEAVTLEYDVRLAGQENSIENLSIATVTITFDWVTESNPVISGVTNGEILDVYYGDTYTLPEVTAMDSDNNPLEVEVSGYVEEAVYEDHIVSFTATDTASDTSKTAYLFVIVQYNTEDAESTITDTDMT